MTEIERMKVWESLEVYRDSMTEFTEKEMDYLIKLVKLDLGLDY